MIHNQRLPPKADLEREFLAGRSFGEIGRKYGVRPQTVACTMKRRRQSAGEPWPILTPAQLRRRQVEGQRRMVDSVTALGIHAEVRECCETYGVQHAELARLAGVSRTSVARAAGYTTPRFSRRTTLAILSAIQKIEARR